jgi:hypothetical protein
MIGDEKVDNLLCQKYPDVTMNMAIEEIGLKVAIEEFEKCLLHANNVRHIVSVGSGNGGFEYILEKELGVNIICIDPCPLSYSRPPILINPHFDTVQTLISEHPEVVSNCLVILNWCPPNDSTFDYEAIQLLNPIAFYTIIEKYIGSNGAGGGKAFHEFIKTTKDYKNVSRRTRCWSLQLAKYMGGCLEVVSYKRCDGVQ